MRLPQRAREKGDLVLPGHAKEVAGSHVMECQATGPGTGGEQDAYGDLEPIPDMGLGQGVEWSWRLGHVAKNGPGIGHANPDDLGVGRPDVEDGCQRQDAEHGQRDEAVRAP